MTNEGGNASDSLWNMSPRKLAELITSRGMWGDQRDLAEKMLEAKALVAMEATARWTRWLVIATFALAVVTVLVTILG